MVYEVTKGARYKHYKGNYYTIVSMATHTETMDGLVIYKDKNNNIWARPVEMFFGYTDDGVKRFVLIDEEEEANEDID
ncbi:DUF1653 domain-containing protein [Paenibacillus sp. FSL M7-0802]|uniref:DUF1653 domain-containing protein n=1 Tax=Paenibacillus sp. FSL M7-0802 TaxID=2921536 RepID=UPI0030F815DE